MINATNCRTSPAVGTGAAQTVSFSFPITLNGDLIVAKVLVASPYTATVLTETTHYTVTNNGDAGGSITTVTPFIANTYNIVVYRRTSPVQTLDLVNGGPFDGPTLESALDKLTKLVQENADAIAATVSIPGGIYTPGTAVLLNVATTMTANSDSLIPTQKAVVTAIATATAGATLLTTTANRTVSALLTFTTSPIVPPPTTAYQAATKGYVDGFAGISGSIVQRKLNQTNSAGAYTTPAITVSNTIMAASDGTTVGLTGAITPTSVYSTIQVEVLVNVASAGIITIFLLQGTTVVASATVPACTTGAQVHLTFNILCTGLTTAQTFTVRGGCSTGNLYIDRTAALTAPFGQTWISSLVLTEVRA
jgi:hypothetical protein